MLCTNFVKFLPSGDTRPFLAKCEDEYLWVIKAHGNRLGTKAIFNEYVVGKLAKAIGLPWPSVSIVELEPNVTNTLRNKGLKTLSKFAVGIKYISDLKKVNWPPDSDPLRQDFPELNSKHIRNLFPNPQSYSFFYGKSLFDNWLILRDTKYDTLFIMKDGNPIFLDASIALGGLKWDLSKLKWQDTSINLDNSPYLVGILSDLDFFEPWLKKIGAINEDLIDEIFLNFPEEWLVPSEYILACNEFLKGTKVKFIPLIRSYLDWEFKIRWGKY